MNNLKRVLSLGLTGAMLAGLLTVGASAADFTDVENITHDDAVNTLVALKIVDGKPDGSFDPEGNVTRAEMAKMIATAMNGGSDANTGVKTNPTFTDIKGHWAESYIEYCSDMKIISGRGDGTFDPGANVTGLEATKMVLTALGYAADAYQLTGATWATRTDELARQASPKLYEDLETVMMANAATRDTAAQLIWNGLQNTTKQVRPTTGVNTGSIEWTYEDGGMMLTERYGAKIWVGTYAGNADFGEVTADAGEIVVSGRNEGDVDKDGDPAKAKDAKVPSTLDISNVGEEVKVIYKDNQKSGTRNQPDKQDTIFGVFNTGKAGAVSATLGDVKNNKNAKQQINVDGTTYDLADKVTVWTNYATSKDWSGADLKGKDAVNGKGEDNSALTKALKKVNGSALKLVLDPDDDKVTTIYVTESKIAKVTAKNSSKVTLSGGIGSIDIADNDVYEDIAKDDIVVVTTLYHTSATNDDAFNIVEKAEVVSGSVKSFKDNDAGTATKTVTLDDGTTYKIVDEAKMDKNVHDDAIDVFDADDHIGEDFDLYMVNGYVAAAVQTSESNSNYSLVIDVTKAGTAGSLLDGLQIRVMAADGTKTVLTLSDDSEDANGDPIVDQSDIKVGDIVTYSTNRDGEADVTIEEAYTETHAAASYAKKTKAFGVNTTSADCVYFASTDGKGKDFKAYKIRDLGDITVAENTGLTVVKDGKDVVAVFANTGVKPSGATSSTVYGIVSAYNGRVSIDGTRYYQFVVDSNEEQYTVNLKARDLATGAIVELDPTSDDIYTSSECKIIDKSSLAADKLVVGYVTDYSERDKTITVANKIEAKKDANDNVYYDVASDAEETVYAIDNDTTFYYVDQDEDEGVVGSISEFDEIEGKANVLVFIDTDKVTATEIVFETSNKADIIELPDDQKPGGAVTEKVTLVNKNASIAADTGKAGAYTVELSATEVEVGKPFTVTVKCGSVDGNNASGEVVTVTYSGEDKTVEFTGADSTGKTVTFTAVKGATDVTASVAAKS